MPSLLSELLAKRKPGRINPSLESTERALSALGSPHLRFPSILVAGTNGKGSTAVMLARILQQHGYSVGLFTSPHLLSPTERVVVDGRAVSVAELERVLLRLERFGALSYFEVLFVAAMVHFMERGIDVAVLEVGMGGRWDATVTARPLVAGLTNVGADHLAWLGPTRADVAAEKLAALSSSKLPVLGPEAERDELVLRFSNRDFLRSSTLVPVADGRGYVEGRWISLRPSLAGEHQVANAHLAVALAVAFSKCVLGFRLDPAKVTHALNSVRWPGRLQKIRFGGKDILVDGAHNVEAVEVLSRYLDSEEGERRDLVFSCLDDKPVEEMASVIEGSVGDVHVVELADPRAASLVRLRKAFKAAKPHHGLLDAIRACGDRVVVAGSLRLVAEFFKVAGMGV